MPAPKDPEKYAEWRQKLKGRTPHNKGKSGPAPHNKGQKGAFHHTDEAKRKIGEAAKAPRPGSRGRPAYNKGKPMSDEQKAKLSAARKGVKSTPEAIEKRRAGIKASYASGRRKISPLQRQRTSAAHKGKIVSAETRAKQSQAKKGQPGVFKGKRHTPESRAKMAQASLEQWEGMTDEQKAAKLETLRASTRDITKSLLEEVIAAELDTQGVIYERQKRIGWYRIDFYLPATNTVIEAQGCYWHGCEVCGYNKAQHLQKREQDAKRHAYLTSKGYVVTLIWEHERLTEIRAKRRSR